MSGEEEVELIIRSAYQSADDLTFSCPKTWTIRQIKEHVRNVLESHPAISTQRLIFSGASLRDEQIIYDILSRSVVDGAQIFHLVIAQPYVTQEVRQRTTQASSNATQAAPPTVTPNAPSSLTWEQWWAQYGQNTNQAQAQYYQYYNEYMRHYYAQQYYMSYAAAAASQTPAPAAQVAAPQNQAAAAPPGERVDALEMFYRLFKLVLLFSAVLLYSSFERFLLVLVAALFIYFIQIRRNQARNRAAIAARDLAQQNAVNNNNNGENQTNPPTTTSASENDAGNASGEGNNAAENEEEDSLDSPPREMAPPPPTSSSISPPTSPDSPTGMQIFFSACYSFITSFFTSLVPDHPLPVDLN